MGLNIAKRLRAPAAEEVTGWVLSGVPRCTACSDDSIVLTQLVAFTARPSPKIYVDDPEHSDFLHDARQLVSAVSWNPAHHADEQRCKLAERSCAWFEATASLGCIRFHRGCCFCRPASLATLGADSASLRRFQTECLVRACRLVAFPEWA